jgi:flagellar protein FliT
LWDELIACETDYVNAVHSLAQLTEEIQPSSQMQEQLRPTLRGSWTTKPGQNAAKQNG